MSTSADVPRGARRAHTHLPEAGSREELLDFAELVRELEVSRSCTPMTSSPTEPDPYCVGLGELVRHRTHCARRWSPMVVAVKIDEKLDDVRRTQRDTVLAKMDRAALAMKEALTIHEHGGNRETAWGKVESESGAIAEVQGSALRALDALADKVGGKKKARQLANATEKIEFEVSVWLAVLARCFQLAPSRARRTVPR